MVKQFSLIFALVIFVGSIGSDLFAADRTTVEPIKIRWTGKQDSEARFDLVLKKINEQTKSTFSASDFKLFEERKLATAHYQFWMQTHQGTPIRQRSLRIWSDLKNRNLIQVEAQLEPQQGLLALWLSVKSQGVSTRKLQLGLNSQQTMKTVRSVLNQHPDDRLIQNIHWSDEWYKNSLTRYVKVKSRRGFHNIWIDLKTKKAIESTYQEFPQIDVPALVFPIYEEREAHFTPTRIPVMLKNIREEVPLVDQDPYLVLRDRRYIEDKLDPILGLDPIFQKQGFWSPVDIKNRAHVILAALPLKPNTFKSGLLLEGTYVTVNLHPAVLASFPGIKFKPRASAQYKPEWKAIVQGGVELGELIPGNALNVRQIFNSQEILDRVAQRHPQHDPVTYINDGFDEIQVYWAVDTFMTTLHRMGFSDPELSTRPFNAILYDPDIAMKDNAYYVDDTINFATYTSQAQNYARDNTTIWHELGHGIMERLMGDFIVLADTGGLSEGMADFLSQLIIPCLSGCHLIAVF